MRQASPPSRDEPATGFGVGGRQADDDFFCLRFRVWYPSIDCAFRTLHHTCPACRDCHQGRFNLKRHRPILR